MTKKGKEPWFYNLLQCNVILNQKLPIIFMLLADQPHIQIIIVLSLSCCLSFPPGQLWICSYLNFSIYLSLHSMYVHWGSGVGQAVVRHSSGIHQAVIRHSSGIRLTFVRHSSGIYLAVVKQLSSGSCQSVVKAVIKQSSGSRQVVRLSSEICKICDLLRSLWDWKTFQSCFF